MVGFPAAASSAGSAAATAGHQRFLSRCVIRRSTPAKRAIPPLGADICLSAGQMLTAQTRIFCTSAALCQVQAGRQTRTCGCRRSSDEGRCLRAVRTA
jgi:hypothetical protein